MSVKYFVAQMYIWSSKVADGVKLCSSFDDFSGDLQIVSKWQMRFAFNESTVHRISNYESLLNSNPGYTIVCQSKETRHLGIIIDSKLDFNCHIFAITYKASVGCTALILRTFVSRDARDILMKTLTAYVRPILECSHVTCMVGSYRLYCQ